MCLVWIREMRDMQLAKHVILTFSSSNSNNTLALVYNAYISSDHKLLLYRVYVPTRSRKEYTHWPNN